MKDRKQEFKGWLWFNGSNADMDYQLNHTGKNSGVGIDVRKNKVYFSKQNSPVELIFDDKSHGLAITNKNSWDKCPHLIQECEYGPYHD